MSAALKDQIIAALKTIYDPEIPVNIYDLGLIYEVNVNEEGAVRIAMTLTAPACPVAAMLPRQVEQRVREVPGVKEARVELVWDPPWTPDRMTQEARMRLGFF
ncbi:MAG: SUF system Fe-S cluster assembly protein [Bryobacterales bacterium]|nr:SUF system Fe-S cluster assembly protein [Bryobacteraceae bacterium]MDW8130441.1 SUF system Fe-S cluster assembly protein [Bryobacterales bacterium]